MASRRLLRGPATAHAGREALYVLASLPIAVLGFAYVLVALGFGIALTAALVGLPLIALTLVGARWFGFLHRELARRYLGVDVDIPRLRPGGGGFTGWLRIRLTDPIAWRAVAYLVLKPLHAVLTFAVFVACWAGGLMTIVGPIVLLIQGHQGSTWPVLVILMIIGVVLLLAARHVTHGMVLVDRVLVTGLLGPTSLVERVHDLENTRATAVDDAAGQLRRIERDLHDGTQARLITLALRLGMAKEEPDPDRAKELLDTAHAHIKDTITELRDLIRGIHPPILDTGLPAALESLVTNTPIATTLRIDLVDRPSPAMETITYYCAAELLTNVAKHANAQHTTVHLAQHRNRLRLRVEDDGSGGAHAGLGTGLAGLTQRVRTVDGRLDIHSPPGGPTTVTIELPLHA